MDIVHDTCMSLCIYTYISYICVCMAVLKKGCMACHVIHVASMTVHMMPARYPPDTVPLRRALQREVEEYRRQGETWQMEQGILEVRC